MVVKGTRSSSLLSKEGASANPKGKVKKKVVTFKSKLGLGGSEIVKRKEPEDGSHRTKKKVKMAKVSAKKVSSGLEGSSTGRVSSSTIQVFDHLFVFFFFMLIIILV